MAISLFSTPEHSSQEITTLVGESELQDLWKPIIERAGLNTLDYIVSAGLTIDNDNCREVIEEFQTLLDQVSLKYEFENTIVNPVFRIQRALDLLNKWRPGCGVTLYIG